MTKHLLLKWVGKWTNEGLGHGRGCLFNSKEAALAWAKLYHGNNGPILQVIQVTLPPNPVLM